MATFDKVICEVPLPVSAEIVSLQTKDFNCELETYRIDRHGWLLRNGVNMDFHGTMRFHGVDKDFKPYYFKAQFAEGDLVAITLICQAR